MQKFPSIHRIVSTIFTVLRIIFESVTPGQKIFDQQIVNFVQKKKQVASFTNLHCTHLCLMRCRINPLSDDYS